ncbi:hypothetical protein MKK67_15980 [Methylobacterium sp. J-072]|uniref:hypothetical protein n=1 Tax=Methylobacterium sp. J-072 TaxID=2836651 RepID=UPI001FBAFEC7|nr:hypothetical protein [Methylobacterium sp. J-072]MCJ2093977.1 hypothetical protein [Methylobacterium sp. J-072]
MPRTPDRVTQAGIARAIRAMRAAGYPDVRVVFRAGSIIVEAAPEEAGVDAGRPKKQERLILL